MKRFFSFVILIVVVTLNFSSCSEDVLETVPTTAVAGSSMFDNANAALVPLNGIYRAMYSIGLTTTGNYHQCFGISAYTLAAEVMGDDMIQSEQGSGWFWYDCIYGVKDRYASSIWRPYDLWSAYYQWIANANYLIAAKETMGGPVADVNNVIGQAYAIRAYSYFMLSQWFCRTYKGHETEKGVPIYTEPSVAGTEGQGRGTLEELYKQINADIDTAIARLDHATKRDAANKSHINNFVAYGIKARICMVQEHWEDALNAAREAQKGGKPHTDLFKGMNSVQLPDVLWGATIVEDQSGMYASLMMHMDRTKGYGESSRKQINKELYARLGLDDIRKKWWDLKDKANNKENAGNGYQQVKFRWADLKTYMADYIWMRSVEFILTEAEALCRLGKDEQAQNVLNDFMQNYRDKSYDCTSKTGTDLGTLTYDWTGSLLEEILIQRRIELWGEAGRIFDIRRLKQGFKRTKEQGWSSKALLEGKHTDNPESYDWVMTIPQKEFDSNKNLNFGEDQNPLDSGI